VIEVDLEHQIRSEIVNNVNGDATMPFGFDPAPVPGTRANADVMHIVSPHCIFLEINANQQLG
jgi:hypothetical protein